MPVMIPLIRSFALLPTLRWLADAGAPIERCLAEVDLPTAALVDPFRPVPLVHAAALLRNAARVHGPDLPSRIIATTGNLEIAMLGKVALGASTPCEALARIAAALPCYCSHEHVSFERQEGQYIVREFFAHRFDAETLHDLLQYAAAMIDRVLAATGETSPCFTRLAIPPHPVLGVEHLRSRYGERVVATTAHGITMTIDASIMERRFSKAARERLNPRSLADTQSLRSAGALTHSVAAFLALMIQGDQVPTIQRVAAAAGTSVRSFQRQLEADGTSFSKQLAEARRSETLKRLQQQELTIASIAATLGYSDQATFTRAFRRWTGAAPGQYRERSADPRGGSQAGREERSMS